MSRYTISYEIIDNQNQFFRYYDNDLNQIATNISDYTITYKILYNNGTQDNIFYNRDFEVFNQVHTYSWSMIVLHLKLGIIYQIYH